jgi:hypothetical protein
MNPATCNSILAACLLTLGTAWSGPSGPSPAAAAADKGVTRDGASASPPAVVDQTPVREETSPGLNAPAAETIRSANSLKATAAAYGEHAPLALFSLGSLAVGGVFYGINASMHRSNVAYTAGDRTQLTSAVGIAGLTALVAAGSYFYYAHRAAGNAVEKARNWDAQVTGGISPQGEPSVGALLRLPLPSLSR